MPAQKLADLLARSGELRTLSGRARGLIELQQALLEAVPPPLATAARIKNFRAGTLFLLADNAAVAAKLRQLAPRLLTHVRKRHTEVTGIRVEVQVMPRQKVSPGPRTISALPVDAVDHFRALAESLEDSPLRSAVTRLVRRHTRGRGSTTP